MAKDTFYFSHDYNARNDPKILELRSEFGLEGYGIYWCLIETMAEDDNGVIMASLIGGLSVGFGVAKGRLIEIIDFMVKVGLLHKENDTIFSQRLVEHKMYRKALSDKGKEGAEKRWKNSPPISPPNAKERKGKESKGNDSKEKESITNDIINGFENSKNKSYKFVRPTFEEIKSYCAERRNTVNPNDFLDFYQSKGWLIGKTPMKDWKAAIRTWERNSNNNQPQQPRLSFEQNIPPI